jgi:hypothetical protein
VAAASAVVGVADEHAVASRRAVASRVSHPEIFKFHDVIKIKNKTIILS